MPSSLRTSATVARTLLLLAMSTLSHAQGVLTEIGCYSSSAPLTLHNTYLYQTASYCQPICEKANLPVMGLTGGNACWCGTELPAVNTKADNSSCNTPCDGYATDFCGGNGFWSIYTTGTQDTVPTYGGTTTSSATSAPSSTSAPTPSVVTRPGTTILVTSEPEPTNPADSQPTHSSSSGGGVNVAGVAAGVVVAVVVVTGAVAGLLLWLRYRKRRAVEEEVKQRHVAEFTSAGERKPPPTGYSSTSDSRLEPAFGDRRNSMGSIADNEDYSRKILRVANPDRSSGFAPPDRISVFPPRT